MIRCLFILVSFGYVLNSESMESYIEGRHFFVNGEYRTCVGKMSDIVLHSNVPAVAAYARAFLRVFFSKMQEEDGGLSLSSPVSREVEDVDDELIFENKQSLSLTATSRGKLLLENDNWSQAKKWLSTARELDSTNTDASCYLQDIEEDQPQTAVYPAFESIDLGD